MRVEYLKALTTLELKDTPGDMPRTGDAPGQASRHIGRFREPEIATRHWTQPIAPVENTHVLVARIAETTRPNPAVVGAPASRYSACERNNFLGPDDVGIAIQERVEAKLLSKFPVVGARRPDRAGVR